MLVAKLLFLAFHAWYTSEDLLRQSYSSSLFMHGTHLRTCASPFLLSLALEQCNIWIHAAIFTRTNLQEISGVNSPGRYGKKSSRADVMLQNPLRRRARTKAEIFARVSLRLLQMIATHIPLRWTKIALTTAKREKDWRNTA